MSKQEKRSLVVVDTDPGTDDALAIFMLLSAHKRNIIDLLGVVCVEGNTKVDNAVRNSLRLLSTVDMLHIPVYKGASESLIVDQKPEHLKTPEEIEPFHGWDGFGDAEHDHEPDIGLLKPEHGVLKLIQLAKTHKGELNIVCLGPLTNIALAIKLDPEFASNVKHFYIMGGNFTARGNITATGEFNFYCDPEAAHIVLANSKCHITLIPWETCFDTKFTFDWRKNVLGTAGTAQINLLDKIEKKVREGAKANQGFHHWYTCDPLATAALICPEVATDIQICHLTVELHGSCTRGQVVLDHLNLNEHNVRLVKQVDIKKFEELMLMAVEHPKCSIINEF